ncbi:type I restriction endonuclease subunit R, EcoR124 family [Pseudorhodobacter aquimaris]|uniref:type I restriction endonuclease subunit R, EcoR124 family n=1 Tax=Pseudorhodobacter aquimaris TaxID=687412 RepID=UPI00067D4EA3|nr:hypothetical protein [Pseudorhodobacter aquimaris]
MVSSVCIKVLCPIIDAFHAFARAEQAREVEVLNKSEGLDQNAAKRFIATAVKREFASENGVDLNVILSKKRAH